MCLFFMTLRRNLAILRAIAFGAVDMMLKFRPQVNMKIYRTSRDRISANQNDVFDIFNNIIIY